jgi:hypothetical protein
MRKLTSLIIFCFLHYFFYVSNNNPAESSQEKHKKSVLQNQKKQKFIRGRRRKKKNIKKKQFKKSFRQLKQTIESTKNEELIQTEKQLEDDIKNHIDPTVTIEKINTIAKEQNLETVTKTINENKEFFNFIKENIKKNSNPIIKTPESKLIKEVATQTAEVATQTAIVQKETNSIVITKQLKELKNIGKKINILIKNKSLINILQKEPLANIIKNNQKIPKSIIAKTHPDKIIQNKEKNKPSKEELREVFISFNAYNNIIDEIEKTKKMLPAEPRQIKVDEKKPIPVESSSKQDELTSANNEPLATFSFIEPKKKDTILGLPSEIKSSNGTPKNNKEKDTIKIPIKKNNDDISSLKEKKAISYIEEKTKKNLQQQLETEDFITDQKRIEDELMAFLPKKPQTVNKKYKNNKPQNNIFIEEQIEKNNSIALHNKPNRKKQKKATKNKQVANQPASNIDLEKIHTDNIKLERETKQKLNIENSKKEKRERAARKSQRLEEEAKQLEAEYNKLENEWQANSHPIKTIKQQQKNTDIPIEKTLPNEYENIEHNIQEAEIEFYNNKELTKSILTEIADIKNQINQEQTINTQPNSEIAQNNTELIKKLNILEENIEQSKKKLEHTKEKLNTAFKTKSKKNTPPINFIPLKEAIANIEPSSLNQKLTEIKNQYTQNTKNQEIEFNKKKKEIEITLNQREQINKDINKKKEEEKKEKKNQEKKKEKKALKSGIKRKQQLETENQIKKQQELDKKAAEEKLAQEQADLKRKQQLETENQIKKQQELDKKAAEEKLAQEQADLKQKQQELDKKAAEEKLAQKQADLKRKQQELDKKAAEEKLAQEQADLKQKQQLETENQIKKQQELDKKAAEEKLAQEQADLKRKQQLETENQIKKQQELDKRAAEEKLAQEEAELQQKQLERTTEEPAIMNSPNISYSNNIFNHPLYKFDIYNKERSQKNKKITSTKNHLKKPDGTLEKDPINTEFSKPENSLNNTTINPIPQGFYKKAMGGFLSLIPSEGKEDDYKEITESKTPGEYDYTIEYYNRNQNLNKLLSKKLHNNPETTTQYYTYKPTSVGYPSPGISTPYLNAANALKHIKKIL